MSDLSSPQDPANGVAAPPQAPTPGADPTAALDGERSAGFRTVATDPDAPRGPQPAVGGPVVVVGASERGIGALEAFLAGIPAGVCLALVVCVEGADAAAVARRVRARTPLPVHVAAGRVAVRPGAVVVVPDGTAAAVAERGAELDVRADLPDPYRPTTLDGLLFSLAERVGPGAVAVVLDGPGETGTRGLVDVKERAGLTMAQAGTPVPSAPAFAIATGHVDVVDAPAELARRLVELLGAAPALDPLAAAAAAPPREVLRRVLAALRERSGHDFEDYKPTTLLRRVGRRVQVAGAASLDAYADLVESVPDESDALLRDLLISVTEFFRDPAAFEVLARDVLPGLFAHRGPTDVVRVWVAGCASGEEAYTLAMLLAEAADGVPDAPPVQIFATDIDARALARARAGVYPAAIRGAVSPERLERFFEPVPAGYRVRPALRERVLFASHNLIADPPFSRLDLISCRNVLIYLAREVQARVFGSFQYALRPGGLLFLGTSEGPESSTRAFREIDARARIFARRTEPGLVPRLTPTVVRTTAPGTAARPAEPPESLLARYAAHTLGAHAPPRLLVDERGDVTHLFGRAGDYLRDREGPATQSAVAKIATAFRLDLRTALFRAFHHGEAIETRFQRVDLAGETRIVRLRVAPLEEAIGERLAEVVFVELDAASADALGSVPAADADNPAAARLEDELARTSDRLRSVIEAQEVTNEELRAANEELQSINEELRSATEELETSKEELQSINEELATVNEELRESNDELVRVNADLQNLIASTDIGTVFLDASLAVQRFTPRAADVFHLIPSDLGRPVAHVAHRLGREDVGALAEEVRRTAAPVARTVAVDDGRWVQLRAAPYRALDGRPSGVVLATVDVTDLKAAQTLADARRRQQKVIADLGQTALDTSPDTLLDEAVRVVTETLGVEMAKVLRMEPDGQHLRVVAGVGWTAGAVGEALVPVESDSQAGYTLLHEHPVVVTDFAQETRFRAPELLVSHGVASGLSATIGAPGSAPYGVLGAHSRSPRAFTAADGQFLRSVAQILAAALRRAADAETIRTQVDDLEQVYAQSPVGLALLDRGLRYVRINERLAEVNGRPREAHLGRTVREIRPDLADELEPVFHEILRTGVPVENVEVRGGTPGQPGERVWRCSFTPQPGPDGRPAGLYLAVQDVTEAVRTREALAASQQTLERALRAGHLGLWSVDLEAGTVEYDARAQAILGLPARVTLEEAFGAVHPDDVERVQAEFEAFLSGPEGTLFESEHRHVRPADGSAVWIAAWAHALHRDGRPVRIDGLSQDITARRVAEQTIRVQLGEIEAYFESVPVGVAVFDRAHRYVRVNARMAELFQRPESDFPGRAAVEMNPTYADLHQGYVERVFGTGLPVLNVEMTAAASDEPGRARHWLVSFYPIRGAEGVERVSLVVQDVTPLKQAQAGLERLAADLEARVAERTLQVRRLAADLTQAEQAERQRISQVLHDDLQQILYALQMRLQLLAQAGAAADARALVAPADELLARAIETARTLTVDLSPPILMGEGLDRSFEWLALRMEESYGLRVEIAAEGDMRVAPDVHALLFALVRELLFNVVKHAGVDRAALALRRTDGGLEIVVQDSGQGFAMTSLGRARGGFGLVSVHERLGHIGGELRIDSAPGTGTRAVVRAPAWALGTEAGPGKEISGDSVRGG